jgi:hypothetical protein
MAELHSESKWNSLFRNSQGLLSQMAEQALSEHLRGETKDWE